MKMPAPKHNVHKEPDPQSTQHHRNVQKLIDRPQGPSAAEERSTRDRTPDSKDVK